MNNSQREREKESEKETFKWFYVEACVKFSSLNA